MLAFTGLLSLSLCSALIAQSPVAIAGKPDPRPDPVKGWHDVSPLSAEEWAQMRRQRKPHAAGAVGQQALQSDAGAEFRSVLFDAPGDGRIWAVGATYKASFGSEGLTYIPFLGADAPANYPVQFVVRAVRVGGREVGFDAAVAPTRAAGRVTFDRGAVHECYDLALRSVEQTFVIQGQPAGDVDVDLAIITALPRDLGSDQIAFAGDRGGVKYGAAFLVAGAAKQPIAAVCTGDRVRLHVPATQRSGDTVVIDPIISTTQTGWPIALPGPNRMSPDIAYDATTDRYMMVHAYPFSATDTDIYAEMRDGAGAPIAGSLTLIDTTTRNHNFPRVANLNSADRFLVVTERYDAVAAAGQRYQIAGRTQNAVAPYTRSPEIAITSGANEKYTPDVGGDPGSGGEWAVVFVHAVSATDWDIHLQMVNANGTLATPLPNPIENSRNTIHLMPQISSSNGNGIAVSPRWMIVYAFRYSATDYDIWAATVNERGVITTSSTAIDVATADDRSPSVSSPATDWSAGSHRFMVSYERGSQTIGVMAKVVDANIVTRVPITNLSQLFGLGRVWTSVESDGNRYALVHSIPHYFNPPIVPPTFTTFLSTLAIVNNAFVVQDTAEITVPALGVQLSANPVDPRITSKRSGGGPRTDYAVASIVRVFAPASPWVTIYRGAAASGGAVRRATACGSARIDVTGSWALGGSITVRVVGTPGQDGILYGLPTSLPLSMCPGCTLGVANGIAQGNPLTVPITTEAALVGATFSFQGFSLSGGTCLGSIALTDTIDVTLQ